jgi:YesN/AraC family two-component response regulator
MPVMGGLEMAREIKARDQDIKIIVTSAHSDMSYLPTAIEIGIDGYVIKPVETARLSTALAKCPEVIEYRREKRRYEEERERLVQELRGALDKVKLLSGMLPICATCKKIKNDNGYWQQIEAYIRDHSDAEFSHGFCPECSKRPYPQYHREP